MNSKIPVVIVIATLSNYFLATQAYSATTIKCWENAQKVRECGQSVPPEFTQGRIEVMNSQGQIIKVYERVLTKEERKEARRLAKLKKAEERRKKESRKRDVILMMTFSTEKELTIAHQNKVEAVQGIIQLTNKNNEYLDEKLAAVQKQLANYERAGETAPPGLYKNMNILKSKIKENTRIISSKQILVTEMNSQFDADLKRYKELKSYQINSHVNDEDDY